MAGFAGPYLSKAGHKYNICLGRLGSRTGDIPMLTIFPREVIQLTDWQTYKKFRIIRNYVE